MDADDISNLSKIHSSTESNCKQRFGTFI